MAGASPVSEKPSVFEAWNAVMKAVQSIGKDSINKDQGFRFRGIDAVVDKVGPLLREHGVIVVPGALEHEPERYVTKKGASMLGETVKMAYTVYGPNGDSFPGAAYGSAADAGDKAMAKAESVALRVFLLQALMIPTGDVDPDTYTHERADEADLNEANAARGELLASLKGSGWTGDKLIARYRDDFAADLLAADTAAVKAFQAALEDEAQAQDAKPVEAAEATP